MTAENSSHFPYQACLIPNLPGEIQHQVRDITDHVVRPLGMFLAVMSFICNSLVLITVTRTKSLQKAAFLILCSLSITDLIFSLIRDIETLAHEHMCLNQFSPERRSVAALALCNLATLGNLAVISRDRYLAVRKPMWYRSHVTKSRAIKTTCVPWLISLVIAFVVYLSRKLEGGYKVLGQIISLSSVLFCFFVIIFCYVSIYCKPTLPQQFLHIRAILEREKRMANTVGLILLVLLLTFLPALLFPLVLYVKGVKYFQPYVPFYSFLLLLNGILNPLLNFGRNKDMRKALRNLFKCSQQVQPSASTSASQQQQQQQQQQQLQNRNTTT